MSKCAEPGRVHRQAAVVRLHGLAGSALLCQAPKVLSSLTGATEMVTE